VIRSPLQAMRIAWVAALAVFAAGIALAAVANREMAAARARIERRTQELRALRAIEARLRRYESALKEVGDRQPGPPAAPQAILTNAIPAASFEYRTVAATNTVASWSLRAVEVSGKTVALDAAMRAIRELDSVWPRWVLVDLQIRSSADPGNGRVTMRFESIARQDSSGSSAPQP